MKIVNQSTNPPTGALWHLQRSLRWINPSDLEGLYCIRLLDSLPEPNDESDEFYKHAWREGHHIYGVYSPENTNTVSCITLNLGDIYRLVPFAYRWTTVPTILIVHALAHEVAHHLAATRGYIFKRSENFKHREYEEVAANRYAFHVVKKMEVRWYYRLGRWMIKDLSDHHHVWALLDWREKKYEKSAEHWYKAWCGFTVFMVIAYQPLVVRITSPGDGANFTSPATIIISAAASEGNYSVSRVDFYQGANLVGSSTTPPYSMTWSNVPIGRYSLTATATDDRGTTATSDAVSITVSESGKTP